MEERHPLSTPCVERLHVWVQTHCPCLLEDEEFMAGLFVIVEEEVRDALIHERRQMFKRLSEPGVQ